MRWRLILEEFGPELKYIRGENNVVANYLSRVEMSDKAIDIVGYDVNFTSDIFKFRAKLFEY